ncbi:MAG: hypothetical protein ACXWPM_02525 [Bdellovibrionota bacterium]
MKRKPIFMLSVIFVGLATAESIFAYRYTVSAERAAQAAFAEELSAQRAARELATFNVVEPNSQERSTR